MGEGIRERRHRIVEPAMNKLAHAKLMPGGEPEEEQCDGRCQIAHLVAKGKHDRIMVHLAAMSNKPDAADPVEEHRTDEQQDGGPLVKNAHNPTN